MKKKNTQTSAKRIVLMGINEEQLAKADGGDKCGPGPCGGGACTGVYCVGPAAMLAVDYMVFE